MLLGSSVAVAEKRPERSFTTPRTTGSGWWGETIHNRPSLRETLGKNPTKKKMEKIPADNILFGAGEKGQQKVYHPRAAGFASRRVAGELWRSEKKIS